MSYGIYIGRNLTADGHAWLAGYGDEPSSHWLEIVDRAEHAADATITVGVGPDSDMPGHRTQIPQAAQTARHMRVSYSYYLGVPAPITNGGLNEHGVAVRDIWSTSCQALIDMTPKDQTGPNYSDLARIVVERATTAREGVEIMAQLIAEHGYSCYGGNSHIIADPDEAWVVIQFSGGKGLWVAERLGPDSIRASRPGYIGVVPLQPDETFLYPDHFISTAVELGWYDPASGAPFDVNAIYGDGKGPWKGMAWVEEQMRQRAAAAPLTFEDVCWSIQTDKLTGDTAGYGQVVPLVHPSHPDLRMMWHAPVGPVTAPLVPVFLGQTEVPDAFGQHRYLTTGEAHRFLDRRKEATDPDTVSHVPQGIEVADSAVYQYKRLMHLAFQDEGLLREAWDHWRLMEVQLAGELPAVLRSAELLLEAGETDLARRVLTRESAGWLNAGLEDCRALVASGYARLRLRGTLNRDGKPLAPEQYW
ncbi:C69 family dipeptidase [Pseudooceanicola atlanticus]|uniref:Dipeptidase n=1 Tax=Pseudooceanicola atlanticus TaxID=1461694 RepID=A0A0A0EH43_9RHOB|nr:C69 family dipeptidase [Pseudooceanicola atlanticus]KGM49393.1 dipeptidase [Pseudooceanicola atlanticus]